MIPDYGQYAAYIWASYALSAAVIGVLILHTLRGRR